jgi:hypothetical protein
MVERFLETSLQATLFIALRQQGFYGFDWQEPKSSGQEQLRFHFRQRTSRNGDVVGELSR